MRQRNTARYSRSRLPKGKTDWAQVDAVTDNEIARRAASDPDTRLTTPAFWRNARLVLPAEPGKEVVTLRLDRDVLKWFKGRGRGYQTRINAILRAYMMAEGYFDERAARGDVAKALAILDRAGRGNKPTPGDEVRATPSRRQRSAPRQRGRSR
jgi:uncharacterized protein (DUF4415 family)